MFKTTNMKFIITEEEKNRIRGLYEQVQSGTTETLKITKAVFDDFGKGQTTTKGSYVVLSNGKTYKFADNSIGYSYQCSPGEYTGETLPQYCNVSIHSLSLICDSTGCKKDDRKVRR